MLHASSRVDEGLAVTHGPRLESAGRPARAPPTRWSRALTHFDPVGTNHLATVHWTHGARLVLTVRQPERIVDVPALGSAGQSWLAAQRSIAFHITWIERLRYRLMAPDADPVPCDLPRAPGGIAAP